MQKSNSPHYLTYAFFKRKEGIYPEHFGKEDIINAEIAKYDAAAPYAKFKVSREHVVASIHENAAKMFVRHVDEWDMIHKGMMFDIKKFSIDRDWENEQQEQIEAMTDFVRWV